MGRFNNYSLYTSFDILGNTCTKKGTRKSNIACLSVNIIDIRYTGTCTYL